MIVPKRIHLANLPTPIHEVDFRGNNFLMKRDDYTGTELSGNKIRKLEYLLADAVKKGTDYIFTCGGDQSNHARATVIAARKVGIKTKLFLWGSKKKIPDGNLLLDELFGAEIEYLNKADYANVNSIMEIEARKFRKRNIKVIVLPTGGSTPLGIWGYINFVDELRAQLGALKINGIISAHGSGGTTAGLVLGFALNKMNVKVFGVNVVEEKMKSEEIVRELVQKCSDEYKLKIKLRKDAFEILDGYSKEGYKNISSDKLKLLSGFAKETGILLDPAYTGKTFIAFNELFLGKEKKSKVMFLHTGGLFGVFAKRKEYVKFV